MKKRSYNSLSEFYADIKNHFGNTKFEEYKNENRPGFTGLSLSQIKDSQYSYPTGVEMLREYEAFEVSKDTKVRYYDQFDGHDINIDRMYDNLDFLINERKVRNRPKSMDIWVNITESAHVNYQAMLNKTYATLKVVDHLESMGVRTAVYACISTKNTSTTGEGSFVEICVKQHADSLNLGALCTAISPWMFRYWGFLWFTGHFASTRSSLGSPSGLPKHELGKGIFIETEQCHTVNDANNFIKSIKL